MLAHIEKTRDIVRGLKEKHGWIELGSISGRVKWRAVSDAGSLENEDKGICVLEPDREFSQYLTCKIKMTRPAELTRLFFLVLGPEVIYYTDSFLGSIFYELDLTINMGSTERKFILVDEGKVNRRELSLMGEITNLIIYISKRWETLPIRDLNDIEVKIEMSGKTANPPRDTEFEIGVFSKIEL